MALSTKSILEWAGSIRNIFKMDEEPGHVPRSSHLLLDHESRFTGESHEEDQQQQQQQQQQKQEYPASESGHNSETAGTDSDFQREETDEEENMESDLEHRMEVAKARYPGSKAWAAEEERLFEILYLRQDLPMLPSHWNIDFRSFPLPERIFETSEEYPPIIYACEKNGAKEYAATTAITRMIDLTLAVRTLLKSGVPTSDLDQRRKRRRAAALIKSKLDDMIGWAARDGGYNELKYVPNIVVEVVDAAEVQVELVRWMEQRMRALVLLQQEYLREDRDKTFWTSTYPKIMGSVKVKKERGSSTKKSSPVRAGMKRGTETRPQTPDLCGSEMATESPYTTAATPRANEYGASKRRLFKKPKNSPGRSDVLGESLPKTSREPIIKTESPSTDDTPRPFKPATEVRIKAEPESPSLNKILTPVMRKTPPNEGMRYRHKPPVVYGLYILGTSVIILTADSSKGASGYISFHLDLNFADSHQSVWNALTVAAIVCGARDELMTRINDFEPVVKVDDSDPDA